MSEYDVVIVGDGIAGLVAHLTLLRQRPGLNVLLVSAPRRFAKAPKIGEHLPASAKPLLEELELWQSFNEQETVPVSTAYSVWGSALLQEQHVLESNYAGGWSIDRRRFEDWLSSATLKATSGSPKLCSIVRKAVETSENHIELTLDYSVKLKTRFVIDATGRKATISRHHSYRQRLDKLIGTYNYFRQSDETITPSAGPLVEALSDGWFYSALLPECRAVVCWFTDADLMPRARSQYQSNRDWFEQLESSGVTRRRLESAGYKCDQPEFSNHFYADASSRFSEPVCGRNWLAVGDAAMTFDPLSSHGMVTAMWSGGTAAKAVVDALDGNRQSVDSYASVMANGYQQYWMERKRYYAVEQRFDTMFWQRRKI